LPLRGRPPAPALQCTGLLKEKSDLAGRVQALEAELGALRSGAGSAAAASKAHEAETGSLKAAVADLHTQLEATKVRALPRRVVLGVHGADASVVDANPPPRIPT
jgi:hypothetical protein